MSLIGEDNHEGNNLLSSSYFLSFSLCHLGNIVSRNGRVVRFYPAQEQILGDEEAAAMLSRNYREGHWAIPQRV